MLDYVLAPSITLLLSARGSYEVAIAPTGDLIAYGGCIRPIKIGRRVLPWAYSDPPIGRIVKKAAGNMPSGRPG